MLSITQFPRRFPTIRKFSLPRAAPLQAAAAVPLTTAPPSVPANALHFFPPSSTPVARGQLRGLHTTHPQLNAATPTTTAATGTTSLRPLSPTPQGGASQSFATSAAVAVELDDDDADDHGLYGPRGDAWFTTRTDPRTDPSFPGRDSATGRLHALGMPNLRTCSREDMLAYFDNSWALTDALFATLQGPEAFLTPPPHQLRHPLIFYYGHPTVFYVNKFVVSGLLPGPVNAYFEQIFEVGVDEMRWDDMSKNAMSWPSVAEVTAYRQEVYETIRGVLETHPGLSPGHAQIDEQSPLWALCMGLEHERIHLETSSMLMQEHPVEFFGPTDLLPDYHPSAYRNTTTSKRPVAGVDYPVNAMIPVPGGRVDIGKPRDFPTFGWDNEYGHKAINVPVGIEASKFLISNGEFWEFVAGGGYLEPAHWSPEGWEWRCFRNTKWPQFWVPDGPSGSHQYKLRAILDVLPMQWDWPAQVNFHEAQAYCKWRNARDGNADRVAYRLTSEPVHQLLRDPKDRSDDHTVDDVLAVQSTMASDFGKNLNFSHLSFSPVDAMAPSAGGFHDVFGNAWEWCEDMFSALPGFKLHKYYDDFSAPCFDGEHQVILGGSFISSGDNGASKFARYHFRPHFFQHAGFRLVAHPVDPATKTITLATTCVNAPGPYVNTNPFRTSDVVPIAGAMPSSSTSSAMDSTALFDSVYRQSERMLEAFVESIATTAEHSAPSQTVIVRNGVEGAAKLKEQLQFGDVMVVVSNVEPDGVAEELADDFELVHTGAVPVFTKDSATEARIAIHKATAWKKAN